MTDQYSEAAKREEQIRRAQAGANAGGSYLQVLRKLAEKRTGGPHHNAFNGPPASRPRQPFEYEQGQQPPQPGEFQEAPKELPYGAVGWDFQGQPYYGDGPKGFWNEIVSRLTAPVAGTPDFSEAQQFDLGSLYHGWAGRKVYNPLSLADIAVQKLENMGEPGQKPTLLGNISRGIGVGIGTAGRLLGVPGEEAEKAQSVLSYGLEAAGKGSPLPEMGISPEAIKKEISQPMYQKYPALQILPQWAYYFTHFMPGPAQWFSTIPYNLIRAWTTPTPGKTIVSEVEKNYGAGRIFYSTFRDPLLRQKYIDRVADGENPYLLARELENPWMEMGGRSIIDPLWGVGSAMGDWKKARQIARLEKSLMGIQPELKQALTASAVFTDADVATGLKDAVVPILTTQSEAAASGYKSMQRARTLFSPITTAKRLMVARDVGELGQWFALTTRDLGGTANELLDLMVGMAKMAGKNADEVAEGVADVRRWRGPLQTVFSDPAANFRVMVRKVIGETPEGLLDAKGFLGDVEKARSLGEEAVIDFLGKRFNKLTTELFPTLEEMEKAAKMEASARTPIEEAMAVEYNRTPPYIRALTKVNKGSQKYFYGPANNFFATVYMGLSPGYFSRNTINNYFTMFVDEGPGIFFHKPKNWAANTKSWLSGATPMAAETGFSGPAAGGGVLTKFYQPAMGASEVVEKGAAQVVVGHAVERTMKAMVQPGKALPNMDGLIQAGLSRQNARHLADLVLDNYGNVPAAVKAFKGELAEGSIDAFKALGWINPDDAKLLEKVPPMRDALRQVWKDGGTLDEIQTKMKAIRNAVLRSGDNVVNDVQGVAKNATTGDEFGQLLAGLGDSHPLAPYAANNYMANHTAISTIDQMGNKIGRSAIMSVPKKQQAKVNALVEKWEQYFATQTGEIQTSGARWRQEAHNILYAVREKKISLEEGWYQLEDLTAKDIEWQGGKVPTSIPEFGKRFYDEYFYEVGNKRWSIYRDYHWEQLNKYVADLQKLAPNMDVTTMLQQVKDKVRHAQAIDMFPTEGVVRWKMLGKSNAEKVRILAWKYGQPLPVEGITDAQNDRLIVNLINENLPQGVLPFDNIKAIGEADLDVIDQALQKYTLERSGYADLFTGAVERELMPTEIRTTLEGIKAGSLPENFDYAPFDDWIKQNASQEDYRRLRELEDGMLDLGSEKRVKQFRETIEGEEQWKTLMAQAQKEYADHLENIVSKVETELPKVKPQVIPPWAEEAPSEFRLGVESRAMVRDLFDRLEQQVIDNYGVTEPTFTNPAINKAVDAWAKDAAKGVAQARLIATKVGDEARKFTLLSYPEKTYMDLALAYIFPYHFWYGRTYLHWLERIVSNPAILAGYTRYKEALAKIHADAPEWWKYSINSNEMLGLDSENPLYFNLEATLNPMYGLMGIDFNDPAKRSTQWAATIDDMSKFGPTLWTPFNWAVGAAMRKNNDDEAAARWFGRLVPETATLKSITALLNVGPKGGVEADPFTNYFSGGLDPYERRRVGRALADLAANGMYDQATIYDAAHTQSGPAWDDAKQLAATIRAGGQITGQMFGVGFKARTQEDLQIDQMYEDYFAMWANKYNYSPAEFKRQQDALRVKYPFLDTVLLSRKGGVERDSMYVYNVMSRIPPGQKSELAKMVGLDERYMDKFYNDKGALETWKKVDYDRLMNGMTELGALLDMPDDATRQEWTEASNKYNALEEAAKQRWGSDIWQRVDSYFAAKGDDQASRDRAQAILDRDPFIGQAMDFKTFTYLNDPILSKYYVSLDTVQRYFKGKMYDEAEKKFGADIQDVQSGYFDVRDAGGNIAKYKKQYPQLQKYWDWSNNYMLGVGQVTARVSNDLQEGLPATIRPGAQANLGIAGQGALQATQNPVPPVYTYTWSDWQRILKPQLTNLIVDFLAKGKEIPYAPQQRLNGIAGDMNLEPETLIYLVDQVMP